jgi:hypothetical protein
MCPHRDQRQLRLITHTRYGPMFGCLACGTAWIARESEDHKSHRTASAERTQTPSRTS